MKKRSLLFWLILISFAGLSLWWTVYFPYNVQSLYRAVPVNADIIVEQSDTAACWADIVTHPVAMNIAEYYGYGTGNAAPGVVMKNPVADLLIKVLASRTTVLARAPYFTGSRKPALIIASWTGWRGQILKLALPFMMRGHASRVGSQSGVGIWAMRSGGADGEELFLSFAIVEGVFVGCLSDGENAAGRLVDRIQRQAESPIRLRERMARRAAGIHDDFGGWIYFQKFGAFGPQVWSFSAEPDPDGGLTIRIKGQEKGTPVQLNKPEQFTGYLREAAGILGDSAGALVMTTLPRFESLIMQLDTSRRMGPVRSLLRKYVLEGSPVFLSLCRQEYSGRLSGVRVPAFMAGVKIKDAALILEEMPQVLDLLNAVYKFDLISTAHTVEGRSLHVFDSVRSGFFHDLVPAEKPVLTIDGDWLLLATSWSAFRGIYRGTENRVVLESAVSGNEGLLGWVDFDSAVAAVVNIASIYDLLAIMGRVDRNSPVRAEMGTIKAWLDIFSDMEACLIKSEAGHVVFRFKP